MVMLLYIIIHTTCIYRLQPYIYTTSSIKIYREQEKWQKGDDHGDEGECKIMCVRGHLVPIHLET
jgi:hypothetical protein